MSDIGAMVARLIEAGTPPALAAEVVAMAFVAGAAATPARRSSGAIRQERYRRNKASQTVTSDACDAPSPPSASPSNGSPTPPPITTPSPPPTPSGADAPAAGAARDIRADLFDRGLKTLARITGKTPDSSRSLVGKWLKSVNDEAIHVLAAIDDAERNQVADPVAWIQRRLDPKTARAGPAPRPGSREDRQERFANVLNAIDPRSRPQPHDAGPGEGADPPPLRLIPTG